MSIKQEKGFRRIFGVLVIVAILANIKSILNDYNVDSGYAVVMSYRQAQGEMLLSEMWDPHQTSGFLAALFIKFYLMILGTTTGIVLYLQVAGVIIRGLFTLFFYHTMRHFIRKDMLMLMCLFFFSVTPKGLPMPEFSNMQVWFSLGLICSLIRFLRAQDKKGWLLLAGIFLCLQILAYPSCLIVYAGVVGLLARYGKKKWKSIGIFTGICACGGGLYCGWLLYVLGPDGLISGIKNIVSGDSSHSASMSSKFVGYVWEGIGILGFFLVIGIFTYVILRLIKLICRYRKLKPDTVCTSTHLIAGFYILLFASELIAILMADMDYCAQIPMYIPIIVTAVFFKKYCTECEHQMFVVATFISFFSFLATLMLTNLTVNSSLSYVIPAIMMACIPIVRGIERLPVLVQRRMSYSLLFLFCGVVIFRSGYLFSSMSGPKTNLLSLGGIVKDGPAVGIISEYMGPYVFNETMQEWQEMVNDGDSVLIVGGRTAYDPLPYLFGNVEISVPSTICTPTYDEKLLDYWDTYPEKYPDVIMVDCWYGDLRVSEDSWIMQWIREEYPECNYVDGKYWRYYRLTD